MIFRFQPLIFQGCNFIAGTGAIDFIIGDWIDSSSSTMNCLSIILLYQSGLLLVINGVITPINGRKYMGDWGCNPYGVESLPITGRSPLCVHVSAREPGSKLQVHQQKS